VAILSISDALQGRQRPGKVLNHRAQGLAPERTLSTREKNCRKQPPPNLDESPMFC